MTTEVKSQRPDALWAGPSPPAPGRSRRQRNAESLARVALCTAIFGGVAWFLGGWQWGVPVGLLALAHPMDLRARPDGASQPGVAVTVLAVQDDWLFVQSDDGTEGWTRL